MIRSMQQTSPPELVAAAKKLRTSAVAQLLENEYPPVYRLACGLAGREDVGRGIAKFVLGPIKAMAEATSPAPAPA